MGAFSARVYEVVSRIPAGSVMTYKGVAKAAGRPDAARAVGNALNRNRDTERVPCHRVVRSDGKLGGYVWGSKRKAELLRGEGVIVEGGRVA